jgi:hypothetical protein
MPFTIADWLYLILACVGASAIMAVLSGASWAAMGLGISPLVHGRAATGSPNMHFAVALVLGVLYMPLNALAAWPVLRSCVNGLRFVPWLTETALGAVLGGIVSVPAMVFLLLVPGSVPPIPRGNPIGWLPSVAAGVAALLPPGLLLQRLGGVRAWPSLVVVAAAMAVVPAVWGRSGAHEFVPNAMLVTTIFAFPAQLWLAMTAAAVVMSGVLTGLTLGAGLFLMARARMRAET